MALHVVLMVAVAFGTGIHANQARTHHAPDWLSHLFLTHLHTEQRKILMAGNLEAEAQDAHQPDHQNTSDTHDIQGHQQHVHQSSNQSVQYLNHSHHNHGHFTADEEQQSQPSAVERHSHLAADGDHSHSAADGHDHSACGHNTAVAPWMHQQLLMFDTAKEAAHAIAKTSVKAATGDTMPPVPAEIRIHTDFQLSGIEDASKR